VRDRTITSIFIAGESQGPCNVVISLAHAVDRQHAGNGGTSTAFLPGVLVLGGDVKRARRLDESCFRMWNLARIEPEVLDCRAIKITSAGYPFRPEIVESAYRDYASSSQRLTR
jgi:hypothetical protein